MGLPLLTLAFGALVNPVVAAPPAKSAAVKAAKNPSSAGVAPIQFNFPPDIDVSGPSGHLTSGVGEVEFQSAEVYSHNMEFFHVFNHGDADLTDIEFTIVGDNAGDFRLHAFGMTGSLSPWDSGHFYVDFLPTAAGERTATLQISSNDPDESPFIINLKGTGTQKNRAPVINSVSLSPSSPKTDDTLTATVDASDADGDDLTYSYAWTRNGEIIEGEAGSTLDLSAVELAPGDNIKVEVEASDGEASSEPQFETVTVGNYAPINGVLTPAGGSVRADAVREFSMSFSDGDGANHLSQARLLIGPSLKGAGSFYVLYNAANNGLYLFNDAGTSLSGGDRPGDDKSISNSAGTLELAQSSVTKVGNTLTLRLAVRLKNSFVGVQNIYAVSRDGFNAASPWTQMGQVLVLSNKEDVSHAPFTLGVTPNSPSTPVLQSQTLTSVFKDENGHADIKDARILVNTSCNAAGALYGYYDAQSNKLYLIETPVGGGLATFVGGFAPGSENTIISANGTLNCAETIVERDGNSLSIGWNLTPGDSLNGSLGIYLVARDNGGKHSGWGRYGTWNISEDNSDEFPLDVASPAKAPSGGRS